MLDQIRDRLNSLPPRQTALGALLVAVVALAVYVYLERAGAQDELQGLGQATELQRADIQAVRSELVKKNEALREKRDELARTEDELKGEQAIELPPPPLTSKLDAFNLRTLLLNYAAERSLGLETFLTSQGSETLGDLELPSISYSVVVEAAPAFLVGMLNIVEGVLSARIDRLEFVTNPAKAGVWVMSIDLAVLYAPEA